MYGRDTKSGSLHETTHHESTNGPLAPRPKPTEYSPGYRHRTLIWKWAVPAPPPPSRLVSGQVWRTINPSEISTSATAHSGWRQAHLRWTQLKTRPKFATANHELLSLVEPWQNWTRLDSNLHRTARRRLSPDLRGMFF